MFTAVTPDKGIGLRNAWDVSSYGDAPEFSPFSFSHEYHIPVPGQKDLYASSVESIWQGLKLIDGKTDLNLFTRKPKKRSGVIEGHQYGGEVLDVIAARHLIFVPAYTHFVDHCVSGNRVDAFLLEGLRNNVFFYDVATNLNIDDPTSPLAHSAVLADHLGRLLEARKSTIHATLDAQYTQQTGIHETLADPVARAVGWYQKASPLDKKLCIDLLRSNPEGKDSYHTRFYHRVLEHVL